MIFLIAAIALNTLIFIIFRLFVQFKINTFQAIVVNYIICTAIGIWFLEDVNDLVFLSFKQIWVQTGIILGVLFIFTFYLLGYTTQVCGIGTTTVANKMSLIIPVFFSIYVFFDVKKLLSSIEYMGIAVAILAILFSSIKTSKQKSKVKIPAFFGILLPFLVFIFGGTIDTLINYSKLYITSASQDKVFTTLIFVVAATIGAVVFTGKAFLQKETIDGKSIFAGVLLGIPNYFSIYFLVKTLSYFNNNGALVYPLSNMGIILASGIFGILVFKEKLSSLNKMGMLLSLVSLLLISHKEIIHFIEALGR